MYKLLNAGFYRLKKEKIFWCLVVITILIAGSTLFNQIQHVQTWGKTGIDQILINYTNWIGIFIALFTSTFIGTEYANGTIRNKIIVGHSRVKIYVSNLIISIVVGTILELIYMLLICVIGILALGSIAMPAKEFAIILVNIFMIIIAYSSIFSFIALLCTNITMTTVISFILLLVMFVVNNLLGPTASADRYSYNITANERGELVKEITGINQNYPGDTKKKICQAIVYSMPLGQADIISSKFEKDINELYVLIIYAVIESVVITAVGIYVFRKKDLK